MSKRILSCMLVLALVIGSATVAFAGNVPPAQQANYPGGASLQYVSMSDIDVSLSITSSTAKVRVFAKPQNGKNISKVVVTGSLTRQGDTEPIKTWNATISPNAVGRFVWDASQNLSKRGTYSFKATLDCYSGNTLVESVSKSSERRSY